MLQATSVSSNYELQQIHQLNQENLRQNLQEEEIKAEGFVTWLYPIELLEKMHNLAPSIIIKDKDKVVGYALVTLKETKSFHPDLNRFIAKLEPVQYKQKPLFSYHFYFMGQVCIHKEYRGKGLFSMLYQAHKKEYGQRFDFILTEVSTSNQRSLKAHQKVGFKTIYTHTDYFDEWEVMVWNWQ